MAARTRTTTVIQNGAITSKTNVAASRRRISPGDLANPLQHARMLSQMQDSVEAATVATRSNPLSAPCIVRNQGTSIGATVVVRHTLGRPLTGWIVVRAVGGAASFGEILPGNGSYPVGLSPSTALVLISGCQGFYDFAISGD